jgi:hypothetical protein
MLPPKKKPLAMVMTEGRLILAPSSSLLVVFALPSLTTGALGVRIWQLGSPFYNE